MLAKRAGFTLVELVIVTLIFGFMMMSLATIYSTAYKHMFQNYRTNTLKSNASVAMKTITTRLQEADRIDAPGLNASGNSLAFAVNVDQMGCYPINSAEMSRWHYFCYSNTVSAACSSGSCLYYHTDVITGGGGCPNLTVSWGAVYPVPTCGCTAASCGTVTRLAEYLFPVPPTALFSRQAADVIGSALVNIKLRTRWDPWDSANITIDKDFRTTAKLIDFTLDTTVKVNRAGLPGLTF